MSTLRVDTLINRAGSGAPTFSNGIISTTGTFTGNVSIGGTLTYEDVQNVDSVGIITARQGIKVTSGGIEVTSGNIVGNLTGDVTGNVSGDLTGDVTGSISGGTVADTKGDVRKIPRNDKTSNYTLIASDSGKVVTTNISGGGTITVDANVFSEGDAVTIHNYGSGALTIAQGTGIGIYNASDASSGNRSLATKGIANLWFLGPTAASISGNGLV